MEVSQVGLPAVKQTLIEFINKKLITKQGFGRATGYYSI